MAADPLASAPSNDNIYLGAGHGLTAGQEVIYNATLNGAASAAPSAA